MTVPYNPIASPLRLFPSIVPFSATRYPSGIWTQQLRSFPRDSVTVQRTGCMGDDRSLRSSTPRRTICWKPPLPHDTGAVLYYCTIVLFKSLCTAHFIGGVKSWSPQQSVDRQVNISLCHRRQLLDVNIHCSFVNMISKLHTRYCRLWAYMLLSYYNKYAPDRDDICWMVSH